MRSILDPKFKYTSSVNTDIAKTFARVRREQAAAKAREETANKTVTTIKRKTA